MQNLKLLDILLKFILLTMLVTPTIVSAVELDTAITDEDKSAFDQILTPVMKIYNFIKYSASVLAVISLLFAGISYMVSGSDPRKRDTSKSIASYVVIGIVIIWAAPFVVNLLIV